VAQFSYFQASEPQDMAADELWYNHDDFCIRRFTDGEWEMRGEYIPVNQQRCVALKQVVIDGVTTPGPVYVVRDGNGFSVEPFSGDFAHIIPEQPAPEWNPAATGTFQDGMTLTGNAPEVTGFENIPARDGMYQTAYVAEGYLNPDRTCKRDFFGPAMIKTVQISGGAVTNATIAILLACGYAGQQIREYTAYIDKAQKSGFAVQRAAVIGETLPYILAGDYTADGGWEWRTGSVTIDNNILPIPCQQNMSEWFNLSKSTISDWTLTGFDVNTCIKASGGSVTPAKDLVDVDNSAAHKVPAHEGYPWNPAATGVYPDNITFTPVVGRYGDFTNLPPNHNIYEEFFAAEGFFDESGFAVKDFVGFVFEKRLVNEGEKVDEARLIIYLGEAAVGNRPKPYGDNLSNILLGIAYTSDGALKVTDNTVSFDGRRYLHCQRNMTGHYLIEPVPPSTDWGIEGFDLKTAVVTSGEGIAPVPEMDLPEALSALKTKFLQTSYRFNNEMKTAYAHYVDDYDGTRLEIGVQEGDGSKNRAQLSFDGYSVNYNKMSSSPPSTIEVVRGEDLVPYENNIVDVLTEYSRTDTGSTLGPFAPNEGETFFYMNDASMLVVGDYVILGDNVGSVYKISALSNLGSYWGIGIVGTLAEKHDSGEKVFKCANPKSILTPTGVIDLTHADYSFFNEQPASITVVANGRKCGGARDIDISELRFFETAEDVIINATDMKNTFGNDWGLRYSLFYVPCWNTDTQTIVMCDIAFKRTDDGGLSAKINTTTQGGMMVLGGIHLQIS
jgi:hypothetical protein